MIAEYCSLLAPVGCLLLYAIMLLWNFPPIINNILYTLFIIFVIWLYYIAIIKGNDNCTPLYNIIHNNQMRKVLIL